MNVQEIPPVLFEDGDYVALNKPAGMLSIPGRFDKNTASLQDILKEKYGDIFTVHRLDKDTSGVICFAKNAEAHRNLNMQLDRHEVRKKYLAIAAGIFRKRSDRIDLGLSPLKKKKGLMVVDRRHGKKAITDYEVIEQFKNYALVQAMPRTGRTHQIRVHLAAIGHPLACDLFYNRPESVGGKRSKGHNDRFKVQGTGFRDKTKVESKIQNPNSKISALYQSEISGVSGIDGEDPLLSRLALHSWKLAFKHFALNKEVEIEAPLAEDMEKTLDALRKYNTDKK